MPAVIPFDLVDGHIFLHATINGSRPLTFILDTGASTNVLNLSVARSLGLKLGAAGKVDGGIGVAPPDAYPVADRVSLALPGVVLAGQTIAAIPLDAAQACVLDEEETAPDGDASAANHTPPTTIDGILGAGFFRSMVVEIDFAAHVLRLYHPARFHYAGDGESIPLDMLPRYVLVHAQLKAPGRRAVPARLLVDTGAWTALSLARRFTDAHALQPASAELSPGAECGIGGVVETTTLVGELESLQIGNATLPAPLTVFDQTVDAREYDGLLGGQALSKFTVIFDYSRRRMILESPR
jgi:hypothetical protein